MKTSHGWVYLATVIDLYNREIIGYSLSKKIDAELAKRTLSNALARNPDVSGLIFHSDRGCQYSSRSYRDMLEQYDIRSSISRPGCPYDNSCAESFFATIKKECISNLIHEINSNVARPDNCYFCFQAFSSILHYRTSFYFFQKKLLMALRRFF